MFLCKEIIWIYNKYCNENNKYYICKLEFLVDVIFSFIYLWIVLKCFKCKINDDVKNYGSKVYKIIFKILFYIMKGDVR